MAPHFRARILRLAAALLGLAPVLALAAPQIVVPAAPPPQAAAPKAMKEAAPVRFNSAELFALKPGDEAELTLPDGRRETYVYEKSIAQGGGMTTWIARSKDYGDNDRAIITTGPGGTWGFMKTPFGDYGIYPGAQGIDWLAPRPARDLTPKFPGGDAIRPPPDAPEVGPLKGIPTPTPRSSLEKSLEIPKSTPSLVTVDVMFLYTKDLANKLGAGLLPMLYNLVAAANQAYADSQVGIALRLVNATMVDLPNSAHADSSQLLSAMAGAGTDATAATLLQPLTWAAGTSVRDQVGADVVALVRDGPTDTGGIGYLLSNPTPGSVTQTNAYSVSNYCASGCEQIVAHEIGHNMGDAHDKATIAFDSGSGTVNSGGVFGYSYGHYYCANGLTCDPLTPGSCTSYAACASETPNDFGTIMSYFSPTVMKFSNPNIPCVPAGGTIAHACGIASQEDNAASMNNVRSNVSAYRTQVLASLPGSLQFTALSFSGTEASGMVTFTVSRASGASGAVSVNYALSGGTATAGVDFQAVSGTLTWADGDTASKTFSVPVTNDLATEGVEAFTATLSSPSGAAGVYLGYPAAATGLILEQWPTGGTMPSGWVDASNVGAGPWAVANDNSYDGDGLSLKSGAVATGSGGLLCAGSPCDSVLQATVNLSSGTLGFAYDVSAYPSFGFLEFSVDGTVQLQATGGTGATNSSADSGWQYFTMPITAGAHTLQWRYHTALSFDCKYAYPVGASGPLYPTCADRAWIDDVVLPVPLSASSTSLVSSANPSTVGQPVTFTATVTGAGAGTVVFRDGSTAITGCEAVALSGSTAACTTSALAAGVHSIAAGYSGSTAVAASLSSTLAQAVLIDVTVAQSGGGSGTVTSTPSGINCGATCTAPFGPGTPITLAANASPGSVFLGWGAGICDGTDLLAPCRFTVAANTSVGATFAALAGAPSLSTVPASAAFGGQSMNTTSFPVVVELVNSGTGTLTIASVSTDNAQFAQTSSCTTLATGASCPVTVTFTPAAATAASGNLVVQTSAGTQMVPLSGTGELSLVTHYYQAILDRQPDASGKTYWDGEATRVSGLGADINEAWYALAITFITSPEYAAFNRDNPGYVTDLYNTFYNRAPDAAGLAYWSGQLDSGLPREVLLASFMFSTEFVNFTQAIFGNTAARAEVNVVMDFYRGLLARLPDSAGFTYWVQQFRTAQCQGGSAVYAQVQSISSAFINSAEYLGRGRTNAQYVGDLYNAFLRRGGDLAGVQYWIGQLDTAAQTREQLRQAFVASPEFNARVVAIVNQGCLP